MANRRKFIKSSSGYVRKSLHQLTSDGNIFEQDYMTIRDSSNFAPGQIEAYGLYGDSNFIFSIRGGVNGQYNIINGGWLKSGEGDFWTNSNLGVINETNDPSYLKPYFSSLTDFAYYGSATELIRATINEIINKFPGAIYITDNQFVDFKDKNGKIISSLNGKYLVVNPFDIDISSISIGQVENPYRYMCLKDYEYCIDNDDTPVTWSVSVKKNSCPQNGDLLRTVSFGNSIIIDIYHVDGEEITCSSSNAKTLIRPHSDVLSNFYNEISDFAKVLLNKDSYPKHKSLFDYYYEDENGLIRMYKKDFIWPLLNDEYNLDIFKHNLNIVKLSSTIKKDIPHVIKKIKVIDQLKKKLNECRDKNRQMDTKLKELKEKERAQNILQNSDITQLCRGFDNNFSISLSEIEFDDQIPEIGKGTFGEVRKGIWRGETVAVKFLKTTMLTSRENIECFVQECNVMKNLRHPNIILYMGASIQGPDFFVVTEYCENGNLFEVLHINKSHKLTWKDKHRIALEIALGMNYLHSYEIPILHRDLKSMNVLLDRNDQVKLADFGNTKILANQMTKQKGTFQWMAPEVIRGSDYTEKSDVFSFGIIMNELATRLPPYQGVDKKEVARKVLSHPDYRPQITKRVPKVWIELMTKCYQQRPEDRPTFNKIIQELKRIDPNHLG
jgi:hypothetical protein